MSTLATTSLNKAADAILGSSNPATVYLALFTGATDGITGGTEVTGTSYARKAVTNDSNNFPAATGGAKTNANAQAFATSGGAWASGAAINCIRVLDASSGGNVLAGSLIKDTLGNSVVLYVTGAGQTITVPASALTLTFTSAA